MKAIYTEKAPAAVGPYSQAVVINGLVYTSGQIALDPTTGELVGTTIEEQAEQVMKNLVAILEAAGTKPENAVKTLCFLTDINDLKTPSRPCASSRISTISPPSMRYMPATLQKSPPDPAWEFSLCRRVPSVKWKS